MDNKKKIKAAQKMEEDLLDKYDYCWNKKQNGDLRDVPYLKWPAAGKHMNTKWYYRLYTDVHIKIIRLVLFPAIACFVFFLNVCLQIVSGKFQLQMWARNSTVFIQDNVKE